MANRLPPIFTQVLDSTPTVRSLGKLYFYAAGTSTPLDTYPTKDLDPLNANSNPIILNTLGQPDVAIWLQNLGYKVVLKDANDVTIWTADDVFTSDYSSRAILRGYAGSPNGHVAGTAASGDIGADQIYDYVNNILYVATTTGNATTTVWSAVNASTAAAVVPPPQGYLTLTSATPIITGNVVAATAVYYTTFVGNTVPIYNGASFAPITFGEMTLALAASHALSTIYDVFIFNNNGVLTIVTGPAWSNSASGTGARGTGAGTTEISRINGLWVNAVAMTGRNGSTTYSIGANLATYVGSIFVDATAGQVTCHRTYGQSRKWGVWNAYNRMPLKIKGGDQNASWSYNSVTHRVSRADGTNKITVFAGLAEERPIASLLQLLQVDNSQGQVHVGWNNSVAAIGKVGDLNIGTAVGGAGFQIGVHAEYQPPAPILGIVDVISVEFANGVATYFGTESNMLLSASWRG